MRVATGTIVNIDADKLETHIRAIEGDRFAGTRIAEFIMGYDKTYWTSMKRDKKCNVKALEKLCAYYNLNKEDYLVTEKPEEPKAVESKPVDIELLIAGLNKLYEVEKANGEKMDAIIEQLRISNTKSNRLENAVGQIVGNVIEIKNTENQNNGLIKDIKSSLAIVCGRLRDLLSKFKE